MSSTHLNHVFSGQKINLTAVFLLGIGCLTGVLSFLYCQQLSGKTQLLVADIQKLSQPKSTRNTLKPSTKIDAQKLNDITAVNAAIAEIVLPWPSIYKTMEASDSEYIKLLAVDPNTKKQTLHITAVALDIDSMVEYINRLTQQKMLKNVALRSQETADINGQLAIHFVVEATW